MGTTASAAAPETLASGETVDVGIERVWWKPGGGTLQPGRDARITVSAATRITVRVRNEGTREAQGVLVRLELEQPGGILGLERRTDVPAGGERQVSFDPVAFAGLEYAERLPMTVEVDPAAGETRVDDNIAKFVVVFSLYAVETTLPD